MTSAVPSQLLPTNTTWRMPRSALDPFASAFEVGSSSAAAHPASATAIALRDLSMDPSLLCTAFPNNGRDGGDDREGAGIARRFTYTGSSPSSRQGGNDVGTDSRLRTESSPRA